MKHHNNISDNRQFVRLKSAIPVDFALIGDKDKSLQWHQGYTCNVSHGGLSVETINLSQEVQASLVKGTLFSLRMHIKLSLKPVYVSAETRWFKKVDDDGIEKYFIGLQYKNTSRGKIKHIMRQLFWLRVSPKTAAITACLLLVGFVLSGLYNFVLKSENERMVHSLVVSQQKEIWTSKELKHIYAEKKRIKKRIAKLAKDKSNNKSLESDYEDILKREGVISDKLAILSREKIGLQKDVVETMFLWLKSRQSKSTGLILSFDGNVGGMKNVSFVHDQALAVCVFLLFDDFKGADKILEFFYAKLGQDFTGFKSGYDFDTGEIVEKSVQVGANVWVGIAAAQHFDRTQEKKSLVLAEKIGAWLISLENGFKLEDLSVESNVDAYAFLNMLYARTQQKEYQKAAEDILLWLEARVVVGIDSDITATASRQRARGSASIVSNTYAWVIASLGSNKMYDVDMNPERIVRDAYARTNVVVRYKRPSGAIVGIKGFSFDRNKKKDAVAAISSEWTSQMIIVYNELAEYFLAIKDNLRAAYYREKASVYLKELNKLIISNPLLKGEGEGCIPYATEDVVDTGHGWQVSRGADTCSVAGTAYMIMAIKKYNPLQLNH